MASLAPTGVLRIAVYHGNPPSYLEPDDSRPVRGVAHDLGKAMAARMGVPFQAVVFPRNDDALRAAREGGADIVFTNASAARQKLFDFSSAVLVVDKSVLVPAGSPLTSLEAVRASTARIGVSVGSSTKQELPALFPGVTAVETASLQAAIDLLNRRELDGFSSNKAILHAMGDRLSGAVVLAGSTGSEAFAIGVPSGRASPDAKAWLHRFVLDVARDGVSAEAVARAGMRGFGRGRTDPLGRTATLRHAPTRAVAARAPRAVDARRPGSRYVAATGAAARLGQSGRTLPAFTTWAHRGISRAIRSANAAAHESSIRTETTRCSTSPPSPDCGP